jgi:hypothetical protein
LLMQTRESQFESAVEKNMITQTGS